MELSRREEQLTGLATGWRTMTYNWRDCALYALAVGAGPDEPQYTYEKGMQVIPTFGVTPYWGTVNVTPRLPRPTSVPVLVEEVLKPAASYVNLDYEFLYHRPIPTTGSFVYRDVLTDLFDRGEGRGMAVRSEAEVFDEAGVLLCRRELHCDPGGVTLRDVVRTRQPQTLTEVFMLRDKNGAVITPSVTTEPEIEEIPVTDPRMARSFPGSLWRAAFTAPAALSHDITFRIERKTDE